MTGFFERFKFSKKLAPKTGETGPEVQDTVPSIPRPITEPPPHASSSSKAEDSNSLQLIAAYDQSVGLQRDHNEDALFSLTSNLVSDVRQIPFGLYVVADGMGGHQHGEMASAIAIRAFSNHIFQQIYLPLFRFTDQALSEPIQDIVQSGIQEANQAVLRHVLGGGTTLTSVLVLGEQITVVHVGDSRAYLIHPDQPTEILTRDHSLVKRLEELGQITPEEAAVHPQRNVLYRALGQGEPFEADIRSLAAPPGGKLLLCSDGLWGLVTESKMVDIIQSNPDLKTACQKLVAAANEAGGPDNITAVLVQLPG